MRRYDTVNLPDGMQGWVIHWEPGEDTGWHDHGDSLAKIFVVRGVYVEYRRTHEIEVEEGGAVDIPYRAQHRVKPRTSCVAIHVYTPALQAMSVFDDAGKWLDAIPASQELTAPPTATDVRLPT